jgi:hypothetical protein
MLIPLTVLVEVDAIEAIEAGVSEATIAAETRKFISESLNYAIDRGFDGALDGVYVERICEVIVQL